MTKSNGNGHARVRAPEQRELTCKLTDAEFEARSDEMADCELEWAKLKEERRGINGQIADCAAKRAKLAKAVDTREEKRDIACEWKRDLKQNAWVLWRTDTKPHEQVDVQPMTGDELTGELFEDTVPFLETEPANDNATAAPARKGKAKVKAKAAGKGKAKHTRHVHA